MMEFKRRKKNCWSLLSVFDKHSLTEIEETYACIEFEVTEIAGITTKLVAAAELERD